MCMCTELQGTRPNTPVLYLSVIISTIVDSATAAEYAAVFIAVQTASSLRLILGELGYPQPVSQICDNRAQFYSIPIIGTITIKTLQDIKPQTNAHLSLLSYLLIICSEIIQPQYNLIA